MLIISRNITSTKKTSRESRKNSRRAEEVPDHSFVSYRRTPQPVESAQSVSYGYRAKSADGRADKKWKMDKVSKPRGIGPTGSATSQEDSDEPVIFRDLNITKSRIYTSNLVLEKVRS